MSDLALDPNGEHFERANDLNGPRGRRAEVDVRTRRARAGGPLDSNADDLPETASALGESASAPPTGSGGKPELRQKGLAMAPDATQKAWRTEFEKQYTDDMRRELVRRAVSLTKRYERFTPRRSTDTAMDRIHAAVAKLYDGARMWDHTRVDLCGFLAGVIASDLAHELRRSKVAPQTSLDDRNRTREDDYTGAACDESGAESRVSMEDGWPVPVTDESPDAWCLAIAHLRQRAGTDALVLALLGAYEEGAYLRCDVMKLLKWSESTYKRAYRRLIALTDEDGQRACSNR